MKKTAIVVIAILCMVLAIGLTACNASGQLATPNNVAISGNTLYWDEVKNASGYIVTLDGKTTAETDNTFYTYKAEAYGKHTMSVVAKGEGNFTNSAPSKTFEFYVSDVLETPVITYTEDGSKLTYTWTEIAHAKEYMLKIGMDINAVEPIKVTGNSYTIDRTNDAFKSTGVYTATVYAVSNDPNYRDSVESNKITYINTEEIKAPANFRIESGTLRWDKSEHANNYRLALMQEVEGQWKEVAFRETSSQSMSYDRFGIKDAGAYKVTIVAFHDTEGNVYTDSPLVKPEDEAFASLPEFSILPKVEGFALAGNTLSWNVTPNEKSKGYTITATTNKGRTEIINIDDRMTTSCDLSLEDAFKSSTSVYKVYTFSIVAKGNTSESIYEGESVSLDNGVYYSRRNVKEEDIADAAEKKAIFPEKKTDNGTYYAVDNFAQLMWALEQNDGTKIVLTNDISIKDTEFISPVGNSAFNGSFDGQGHYISGIKMSTKFDRDCISIFGNEIKANETITNLVISDADVETNVPLEAEGLLARVNNGKIANVAVNANIRGLDDNGLANFVGDNKSVIEDSFSLGEIRATEVGGFAVINNGTISNSKSYTRVSGFTTDKLGRDSVVGGVVAINNATLDRVIATGAVLVNPVESEGSVANRCGIAGGIVGINNGNISTSYFTNKVSITSEGKGQSYIGGFVGKNETGAKIVDSYVDIASSITRYAAQAYAGGFAGYNAGTITNAFSSASIERASSANKNIAGFIGYNESGATVKNVAYHMGRAGDANMIFDNKGTIDTSNAKGFISNEMNGNEIVNILGANFCVYEHNKNKEKTPKLKNVIYYKGDDKEIFSVSSATGKWTDNKDLAKYDFNGESKTMTSDVTVKKSGYQIIKYIDGDVHISRLVRIK